MAQPGDFLKSPAARNAAIGIGVAILAPFVVKALAPFARPVGRSVLKMGIVAYEKGREAIAEFGEIVDDMVAEVREELRAERAEATAAGAETAAADPAVGGSAGIRSASGADPNRSP